MCPAVPMTTLLISSSAPLGLPLALARTAFAFPSLRPLQVPLRFRLGLAAPWAAIGFRHADAIEDADQSEIDLPPLHVDLDHLHAHLVAEAIDLPGILAAQHVRALDEPVIVVRHRRDVHHALDEV